MSASSPFWCDAWPRPPKLRPKRPPRGRERSMIPTRWAPSCSIRNSCRRPAARCGSSRSVPQRRHSRFGIRLRIGSQVKKSSPSSGSRTPSTSRPRARRVAERARLAPRDGREVGRHGSAASSRPGGGVARGGRRGRRRRRRRRGRRGSCAQATAAATSSGREREHDEAHALHCGGLADAPARRDRRRRRARAVPARRHGQHARRTAGSSATERSGSTSAATASPTARPGTYRIADYVADAVSVLESLDRPAALVGHSLGGVVAWSWRSSRPDLVHGGLPRGPAALHGRARGARAQRRDPGVPARRGTAIARWHRRGRRRRDRRGAARRSRRRRARGRALHDDAGGAGILAAAVSTSRCSTASSTARCWPTPTRRRR